MTGRPPPYELFFTRLEMFLDPNQIEAVGFAYIASKYGHAKQERDDGSRYFDHPKAAAWIYIDELGGQDTRVIIDLLLHDLPEDQYLLSAYRLRINFGTDVAGDVGALTKLPKGKETTEQYLGRIIARGPCAIVAKLIDRLHNLRDCNDRKKHVRTVEETRKYHLPLLVPALRKCGGAWATYADTLEQLILDALAPKE